MRKLQFTLVLVALGLAVSIALLASRALQGVVFERAARERAVASRIFDEMERGLSRMLEREEGRSFESYEELSALDGDPFVVGHFQIGPLGGLEMSTPALAGIVGPIWKEGRREAQIEEDASTSATPQPPPGVTQRLKRQPEGKDLPDRKSVV